MNTSFASRVLVLFLAFALCGCWNRHVEIDAAPTGFLRDYSMLRADPDKKISMKYISPGVEWHKYTKIQLDQVMLFVKKDYDQKGVEPDDFQKIIDYFHQALFTALGEKFTFVTTAGPDTLRLRIAVTDIIPSKGMTGTVLGAGQASVEMEVIDSVGGERLAAAIDHRAGGTRPFRDKWSDANVAMDNWSKKINAFLERVGAGKAVTR